MRKVLFACVIAFSHIIMEGQTINQLGFYDINGTMAVDAIADYMMISSGDIIDLSDPVNPVLHSNLGFFGHASTILFEDEYAYIGTGMTSMFHIADVTNLDFPLVKSSIDFGDDIGHGVFGMAIKESVLFAAIGASVCSIDISDKSNPVILDTLFINEGHNSQSRDITIMGDYAFVAHYYGLKVLNVIHPDEMSLVTSIGSDYESIANHEDIVFLGKNSGGFDTYNVSDPTNPDPLFSKTNTGGTAWDIKYKDNHVYLASNSNGLTIYKLENETATEMANYDTEDGGQSFGVCLQDSLILLSELITGVAILQYDSLGSVGVDKNDFSNKVYTLYPNPASKSINLLSNIPNSDQTNVCIYDHRGRLLDEFVFNGLDKKYQLDGFRKGIYYCLISIEGRQKQVIKFVVY